MKDLRFSGGLLVALGAALWSTSAPLVHLVSLDPFLLCALRALIAGIVLFSTIRINQLKWNRWMLIYLVAFSGLNLLYIVSINTTSAPVAMGMQYTASVWIFFADFIRTKRFKRRAFVPIAVILVGIICFMCSGEDATSFLGNCTAFAEGIFSPS